MIFPSEQDFALLLFQLFALLSLGLALGEFFRRLRQPTVIGEILAGVLLGPSVLGVLAPDAASTLFPGPQTQLLGSLACLGSVFLLLVAGLENQSCDPDSATSRRRPLQSCWYCRAIHLWISPRFQFAR